MSTILPTGGAFPVTKFADVGSEFSSTESNQMDVPSADDGQPLAELNANLDKLTEALKRTKDAKELAEALKNRNWFGIAWRSVSGGNTKDLAGMLEDLGGSLETTQLVVQLIMQLQIKKHTALRGFHNALVNKIEKLNKDTTTLDSSHREAAIAIFMELKDHVETQIRHQNLVEDHHKKLQLLGEEVRNHSMEDEKLHGRLDALGSELSSLKNQLGEHSLRLHVAVDELQLKAHSLSKIITGLQDESKQCIARLDRLDSAVSEFTSARARGFRQLPALAALLAALLALALHFMH